MIAVHFGGLAIEVAQLRSALPRRVAIVEDAAHALGARYVGGKPVGSSGNLVCFSFYANKNLSTAEGGAIAISDKPLGDQLRSLRQHGLPLDAWKRFSNPKAFMLSSELTELGYKMNYTDLQAALGRVQLRRQREFAARRMAIAKVYKNGLCNLRISAKFQAGCISREHARHLFTLQLQFDKLKMTREEFILALRARNVGATIHYTPLHTMRLYHGSGSVTRLPNTEEISRSIVTLPISASMAIADAHRVVREIKAIIH